MIVLAVAAALAAGLAIVPGAAGIVLGLALSGAAWSGQLLLFGAPGAGSDLALLAAGLTSLWYRPRPQSQPLPPACFLRVACALAAALVAALFLEHSIRYPDGGWDASAIWNLRARFLYGAPDRLADVFAADLAPTHPDYPLVLPGLVAHLWLALGSRTQVIPIAVSFAFAAAGVVALAQAVARRQGQAAGFAAALLLLGTPDFLTLAWNQYADLKVAMLLLAAVVLATERRYAAAGLAAGLAAFTKNEGAIALVALFVAVLARAGVRAAARFAAGAAAPVLLLAWFKLRFAPRNDLVAQTSLADAVRRAPPRLGIVARGLLLQIVDFAHWGAAAAAIALAWIVRFRRRTRGLIATSFLGLMLIAIACVYLATPWNPRMHMAVSLDRLLFQLWPALLYASALALLPPERLLTATMATTASETQPGQSPSAS